MFRGLKIALLTFLVVSTANHWGNGFASRYAKDAVIEVVRWYYSKPTDNFSPLALSIEKELTTHEGWQETGEGRESISNGKITLVPSNDRTTILVVMRDAKGGKREIGELLTSAERRYLCEQTIAVKQRIDRDANRAVAREIGGEIVAKE